MKPPRGKFAIVAVGILYGVAIVQGIVIWKTHRGIGHLEVELALRPKTVLSKLASKPTESPPDAPATHRPPPVIPQSTGLATGLHGFRENVIRSDRFQRNLLDALSGHLQRRYDQLFKQLKLSPWQQQQLEQLLTQGLLSPELIPSADVRKQASLEEARSYYADLENRIATLLGDEKYPIYRNYKQDLSISNTAQDIAATLAASGNPLDYQAHAFLQATLKTTTQISPGRSLPSVDAVRAAASGSERVPITADFLGASERWLTPAQIQALATMHEREKAIRQAQALKDSLNLPLQLPLNLFNFKSE